MRKNHFNTSLGSVLFIFVFLIFASWGCKKESAAQSEFGSCLNSEKAETLTNKKGTLVYTNQLKGLYLSADGTEYKYVIYPSEPRLSLILCNFPSSIIVEKNEPREIVFSGKAEVLSDLVDAFSTDFELWKLEFVD